MERNYERQRGPSNYAVIEVLDDGSTWDCGCYETIEEARGCVVFDGLKAWEIWKGDTIVEESEATV